MLTTTFDHAQSAFGFDANNLMGDFTVNIFSSSGLLSSQNFSGTTGLSFFGFLSSSQDITSVTIAGNNPTFGFALDNFTFNGSSVAATPLPAAFSLFVTGLGMMGFLAKRRKRNAA